MELMCCTLGYKCDTRPNWIMEWKDDMNLDDDFLF